MIAHHPTAALALPVLSDAIPFQYRIPGDSGVSAPLALALLESPQLSNEMFSIGPNALLADVFADLHEHDLATRVLLTWWKKLYRRYPMSHFKWDLEISDLRHLPESPRNAADADGLHAWFCLGTAENVPPPRFSLAQAAEKLEASLEGLGQTVLAVLYDALRHLPDSYTPAFAHDFAQWYYWQESEDDTELLALARSNGDDPKDLVTRKNFFEDMPRWAVSPQRMLSRETIERAAREKYELDVIAACDAIAAFVNRPDFGIDPKERGTSRAGIDSIDGTVFLVWRPFDLRGAAIDDYLNHVGQSGEYVEYIDMQHVKLDAKHVGRWMRRTEQMLHLAYLTEHLIVLIGEPF